MKAILVIDMPTSCNKCPCSRWRNIEDFDDDGIYCMADGGQYGAVNNYDGVPDWCPLKPMPEKKEVEVNEIEDIMHPSFDDIYTKHIVTIRLATDKLISLGWNACIEEIEK